jgi:hypothetical protein
MSRLDRIARRATPPLLAHAPGGPAAGLGTCAAAVNFNLQCDLVNQCSSGIDVSLAYARFHEGSADVNSAFAAPDINTDKTNL